MGSNPTPRTKASNPHLSQPHMLEDPEIIACLKEFIVEYAWSINYVSTDSWAGLAGGETV